MRNATVGAVWSPPRNYEELYKTYEPFVARIVMKRNKVGTNFAEMLQHIWLNFQERDILGKWLSAAEDQLPKTMTATAALTFLGITWEQWTAAMTRFHVTKRKDAHWMPLPLNEAEFEAKGDVCFGVFERDGLYDFSDIMELSQHINGNCPSEDVWFESTGIQPPPAKFTKAHFQNYLANATLNNYLNWCRTQRRRHKERTFDNFSQFRNLNEDQPKGGVLPDPELVDASATARTEAAALLSRAREKIRGGLLTSTQSIPNCKPVDEYETALFLRMDEGYTLVEALNKLDVPNSYRARVARVVTQAVGLS